MELNRAERHRKELRQEWGGVRPWSSRLVVSVSVAEEPPSMTGLPCSQDSSIFWGSMVLLAHTEEDQRHITLLTSLKSVHNCI